MHSLNCHFAKIGLTVRGLPLTALLQWKATYPHSRFRKTAFQKVRFFGDTKYFINSPFLINHIPPPSFEISDTYHRAKLDHNNRPFIKIVICCIIHYVL